MYMYILYAALMHVVRNIPLFYQELEMSEAVVQDLEGRVGESERQRGEEVERAGQLITQLREQVQESEEERRGEADRVSVSVITLWWNLIAS